jgi:hypothetical protein
LNFFKKLIGGQQGGVDDPGLDVEETSSFGASTAPDVTRYILETYDILEELEHKLRGEVFSFRQRKYLKKGKALMNDFGVNRIILLLSNFINRHIALSNFSDADVRRIGFEIRIELIKLLRLEWKTYEAEKSMLSMIVRMIDSSIYGMLKRAFNAGERKGLSQTYRHIEMPYGMKNNAKFPNFSGQPSM